MSLLDRVEQRGQVIQLGHPSAGDPVLVNWFGGPPSHAGVRFDEKGALSWTALSSGVRLSAETIGSLTWSVYEKYPPRADGRSGGRRERDDHALWWLLHEQPNEEQTPMEFLEQQQAHSLFWGASYAQIVRDGRGAPQALWPLNPDRTSAMRDKDDALWWRVILPGGESHIMLPARDVLAVRGFSSWGLIGERLAELHREAIGLGIATEIFSAAFFGQGANVSGFLSHPGRLSEKARENLEKSMAKRTDGLTNAHRIRILEEAMVWHPTTVDPEKAQLILGRKFQVAEASRILRIPPHLLYDLERATFSNIEHQSIEFVRDHVRPWVVRREQRLGMQMLGRNERGRVYVKASLETLLRGDMKSRMEAYEKAIQNRINTPNEVRELEDWNPGPAELDEFHLTPNLYPPSRQPKAPAKPAPGGDHEDDRGTEGLAPAA